MTENKKIYRIVAIVIAEIYGETPEKAVGNMKGQAETMSDENWIILDVKELKKNE